MEGIDRCGAFSGVDQFGHRIADPGPQLKPVAAEAESVEQAGHLRAGADHGDVIVHLALDAAPRADDGSAQAARAVNDALPFLQGAERVVVVTVNPARGDRAEDTDIARHLARHGIAAEISDIITAHDGSVGEVLLSRVTDEAADLIVMGAYGHSRLRELVLGGVSRELLAHMTVPVLMAH